MTWGRWYWPLFLIVTLFLFAPMEIEALIKNSRNTLSDWVWTQLQVTTDQQLPWTAAHFLTFGAWIVVVLWLTFHFFFRRFT